ncbi:pilus assembly protein PilZ [Leptospira perolatii]|uniref:Pilus assembly protein PilZ n=1 Tax=Leptospira perolatii TaxID=2023191 RepID=A0A2M9ZL56_9LEPT|nr:PilZ domain-containing protein [Leptospira perolatii]PJZ70318.1 pilus assembly protein PilZ [Leptospira perolatii]PJZ72798.1 pilus assembly protein PilZ [Leptospira perolatii]
MDQIVKETEALGKILQTLFTRLPVYVEIKGRSYPVKIVGAKENVYLLAHIPGAANPEKIRTLFLTHNQHFFHAVFTVAGRNESTNLELLRIQAIKITAAKRAQGRLELESGGEKITLTNIINQLHLRRSLGFVPKAIDEIVQKHAKKLQEVYPDSLVYFSDRMDNRLRVMYNFEQSIFVTDRREKESGGAGPKFVPIEEYTKLVSLNKLESRFVSEIAVLIRYKNYTPLGYVQVLSEKPMNTEDYNKISLVSAGISKEIIGSGFFQESKEKCMVEDISRSGLGFFHPQSIFFSRSFASGETLLFDLYFNKELKGTFRAVIRNITNTDKLFRVGCQFFNLNQRESDVLKQYIDTNLGPGEGEQAPEAEMKEGATEMSSNDGSNMDLSMSSQMDSMDLMGESGTNSQIDESLDSIPEEPI